MLAPTPSHAVSVRHPVTGCHRPKTGPHPRPTHTGHAAAEVLYGPGDITTCKAALKLVPELKAGKFDGYTLVSRERWRRQDRHCTAQPAAGRATLGQPTRPAARRKLPRGRAARLRRAGGPAANAAASPWL